MICNPVVYRVKQKKGMSEPPQESSLLRITTWNVLNQGYECVDYYSAEVLPFLHWTQGRRERACTYLAKLDSDIYSLQEVSYPMAVEIHTALGGDEIYGLRWQNRTPQGADTEDGCATLFRHGKLVLQDDFYWRYPSGKHILLACLFLCSGKTPCWVVNTHVNWATRENDLLALQKLLTTHPGFTDCPKIAMGDFNAERHEEWYKALEKNHLVDAQGEHQWPYSYNSGKLSKWIDFMLMHRLGKEAVEQIFVGNDALVPPLFKDVALPNASVPSDHLPLTVVLKLT